MGLMSLDGIPFVFDPDQVHWTFAMKVSERETVGGKVIQILGTQLGDMTVTGVFGFGDRKRGDAAGWEYQQRFAEQIVAWTEKAQADQQPIRLMYAPRKWDFRVFVKGYDEPAWEVGNFNPRWTLTLFIVEDGTQTVVKGIRDLYIKRLMDGIGWKQTTYNGPMTQAAVDALTGGSGGTGIESSIIDQLNAAAGGGG